MCFMNIHALSAINDTLERLAKPRQRETLHRDDIRHLRIQRCGLAAHTMSEGHHLDLGLIRQWPSFENDSKRKYHEALFINVLNPQLNLNKGRPIGRGWLGLCVKEISRLAPHTRADAPTQAHSPTRAHPPSRAHTPTQVHPLTQLHPPTRAHPLSPTQAHRLTQAK